MTNSCSRSTRSTTSRSPSTSPSTPASKALFEVCRRLLGVRFEAVPAAPVWHEDVQAFDVYESDGDEAFARFYMDLFPRPNTFGHAAAFTLAWRAAARGRFVPEARQRDRRKLHEADARGAFTAPAQRGRHALSRVRSHPPPDADASAARALQRQQHRARLRRGALADARALGLGPGGARELHPPPRNGRAAAGAAARCDARRKDAELGRDDAAPALLREPRPRLPLARLRRRQHGRREGAARDHGLPLHAGDALPVGLGAPLRLRRGLLRLPLVACLRRRHVHALRGRWAPPTPSSARNTARRSSNGAAPWTATSSSATSSAASRTPTPSCAATG